MSRQAAIWREAKAHAASDYAGQQPRDYSLLYKLMGSQHREEGRPLSDHEIAAQAYIFILAGYEARPSSWCCICEFGGGASASLYSLSAHKRVLKSFRALVHLQQVGKATVQVVVSCSVLTFLPLHRRRALRSPLRCTRQRATRGCKSASLQRSMPSEQDSLGWTTWTNSPTPRLCSWYAEGLGGQAHKVQCFKSIALVKLPSRPFGLYA